MLGRCFVLLTVPFVFLSFAAAMPQARGDEQDSIRRQLRVALYPYVPEKAAMYWRLEQKFEEAYPAIDLRYVDIGAYYYSGQLLETLTDGGADVVEVDTVFIRDLVDKRLVEQLPSELLPDNVFLPCATKAAIVDGRVYGIPHWVCGNFLFFRRDDPERNRIEHIDSLDDLERLIGHPVTASESLLVDLRGSSTLGEKYLDALLDTYLTPAETLRHVNLDRIDETALNSLNRLFALCPGGLCDSDKHHEFGQFYSRQFAEREARALIGYSERMYFVVDHYLHGVREDQPAVGKITFGWNDDTNSYDIVGADDVDVVPATLSDQGSRMLSWVDILCLRAGIDAVTRKDGIEFIKFFNSQEFTTKLLIPEYGHAPRYLLPARLAVYRDPELLKAAPLYCRFHGIMQDATALTAPDLNAKLRTIGKKIEAVGFTPVQSP